MSAEILTDADIYYSTSHCAAERGRRNGFDFSAISDSQVADDWNFNVFPNINLNVHPEACCYDVWVLAQRSCAAIKKTACAVNYQT